MIFYGDSNPARYSIWSIFVRVSLDPETNSPNTPEQAPGNLFESDQGQQGDPNHRRRIRLDRGKGILERPKCVEEESRVEEENPDEVGKQVEEGKEQGSRVEGNGLEEESRVEEENRAEEENRVEYPIPLPNRKIHLASHPTTRKDSQLIHLSLAQVLRSSCEVSGLF